MAKNKYRLTKQVLDKDSDEPITLNKSIENREVKFTNLNSKENIEVDVVTELYYIHKLENKYKNDFKDKQKKNKDTKELSSDEIKKKKDN